MRHLSRLCLILVLISSQIGTGRADEVAVPEIMFMDSRGEVIEDSLLITGSHPLTGARDLAITLRQEILLLDREGKLSRLSLADSLTLWPFGEDSGFDNWPEAMAVDGSGYLLLVDQGRAVQRLGRRGEDLGSFDLPGEQVFWREMRSDRSGRIWLIDGGQGLTMTLSRSGQLMQSWQLDHLIPTYRGPLRTWCPDQRGGLLLIEGRPPLLHHLNAAGNLTVSRPVPVPDRGDPDLLWDEQNGVGILALPGDGDTVLLSGPLEGDVYLVLGRQRLHLVQRNER